MRSALTSGDESGRGGAAGLKPAFRSLTGPGMAGAVVLGNGGGPPNGSGGAPPDGRCGIRGVAPFD